MRPVPVRVLGRAPARRSTGVVSFSFVVSLAFSLTFVLACASPAVVPPARPAPTPEVSREQNPLEAPWVMARSTGPFANTIRFGSELVSRVDSVERRDTTQAMVSVRWSRLAGADPSRLSGLVTGYWVGGGGAAEPQPLAGLLLPVPFAATGRDEAAAEIEMPVSGACGFAAVTLQPLRELFVSPPSRLVVGTSWSDSSRYALCRDSIPLAVMSVRHYRVVGAERRSDSVVVIVERTSRVTLLGEGVQFGEKIALAAEGTGTLRLELDPGSSTIVAAQGRSELKMTMRGRRRSQELWQRTRIFISSP